MLQRRRWHCATRSCRRGQRGCGRSTAQVAALLPFLSCTQVVVSVHALHSLWVTCHRPPTRCVTATPLQLLRAALARPAVTPTRPAVTPAVTAPAAAPQLLQAALASQVIQGCEQWVQVALPPAPLLAALWVSLLLHLQLLLLRLLLLLSAVEVAGCVAPLQRRLCLCRRTARVLLGPRRVAACALLLRVRVELRCSVSSAALPTLPHSSTCCCNSVCIHAVRTHSTRGRAICCRCSCSGVSGRSSSCVLLLSLCVCQATTTPAVCPQRGSGRHAPHGS